MKKMLRNFAPLLLVCALASPAAAQDQLVCYVNGLLKPCPGSAKLKTGSTLQVNGPATGTVVTATTRTETPTIGTNSSNQHAPPTGTGALVSTDATQTLTSKTLTTPTISSPTLSGTAGGTYTLGGTPTLGADLSATGRKFSGGGISSGSGGLYPMVESTAAPTSPALFARFTSTYPQRLYFDAVSNNFYIASNAAANSGYTTWTKDQAGFPSSVVVFGGTNELFRVMGDENSGNSTWTTASPQFSLKYNPVALNPWFQTVRSGAKLRTLAHMEMMGAVGGTSVLHSAAVWPGAFDSTPTTCTFTAIDSSGVGTPSCSNISAYGAEITATASGTGQVWWVGYVEIAP